MIIALTNIINEREYDMKLQDEFYNRRNELGRQKNEVDIKIRQLDNEIKEVNSEYQRMLKEFLLEHKGVFNQYWKLYNDSSENLYDDNVEDIWDIEYIPVFNETRKDENTNLV